MKRTRSTRRDFLKAGTVAGLGFWVGPRPDAWAETKSPNEKLNIGVIGAGGKGHSDTRSVTSENIIALCDVDERNAADNFKENPQAKVYHDYREMLEKEKTLDAVIVATPDHHHAPASVMAMRMGKHVYCQKPLTHSVYEARLMMKVAREQKVATQMGNQGTSNKGVRRAAEIVQSGGLGKVHTVHVWTNRPIWPQGVGRPQPPMPVPPHLHWDLWLGPAADRPYHEAYCPFKWRGFWDFGTGALGDMACHTANMPFLALKLAYPKSVELVTSTEINDVTYPKSSAIRWDFPARGPDMPELAFHWYDGGALPPKDIVGDLKLSDSGCMLVGDKGMIYSPNDYGAEYELLPKKQFADYTGPPETIPRSPGHYVEWIRAAKGGPAAMANFDYAAQLTETILLGNIALRFGGKKLEWDGANMQFTNVKEANRYLKREYRKGWEL